MKFGERLRELRTAKGLSQMQLSLELHISQSAIAKWELGKVEPTASAIILIAKYFNETTDYMLGVTD